MPKYHFRWSWQSPYRHHGRSFCTKFNNWPACCKSVKKKNPRYSLWLSYHGYSSSKLYQRFVWSWLQLRHFPLWSITSWVIGDLLIDKELWDVSWVEHKAKDWDKWEAFIINWRQKSWQNFDNDSWAWFRRSEIYVGYDEKSEAFKRWILMAWYSGGWWDFFGYDWDISPTWSEFICFWERNIWSLE